MSKQQVCSSKHSKGLRTELAGTFTSICHMLGERDRKRPIQGLNHHNIYEKSLQGRICLPQLLVLKLPCHCRKSWQTPQDHSPSCSGPKNSINSVCINIEENWNSIRKTEMGDKTYPQKLVFNESMIHSQI